MKYLIIYAHPNPKSFNHAILERLQKTLKDAGRSYEVRDLYALKFNPALSRKELELMPQGKAPKEIKEEQQHIKDADVVVFIYPIWWSAMPAILKGYIDRVFSEGFAFAIDGDRLKGLLGGKKAIVINTTGAPRDVLVGAGGEDAMRAMVDHAILEFCEMEVVAHKYLYAVPDADEAARMQMLDEVAGLVT
jgi:NAD(P)H dehydrogenase (quinone)